MLFFTAYQSIAAVVTYQRTVVLAVDVRRKGKKKYYRIFQPMGYLISRENLEMRVLQFLAYHYKCERKIT